jgi:hypothetical protein
MHERHALCKQLVPGVRLGYTMVTLATEHGTSGLAALGFGLYAVSSFFFDLDEGYRAGTIGLRLLEKYHAVQLTANMHCLFYGHVDIWYAFSTSNMLFVECSLKGQVNQGGIT